MRANLHRVAKLEGQPHSSARHSRLDRAMDRLSIADRVLLTELPIIDGKFAPCENQKADLARILMTLDEMRNCQQKDSIPPAIAISKTRNWQYDGGSREK